MLTTRFIDQGFDLWYERLPKTQGVKDVPIFCDAILRDPIDRDYRVGDFPSGGLDVEERTFVGASKSEAPNHPVPILQEFINGPFHVWESASYG
jgi:hypothetical protein